MVTISNDYRALTDSGYSWSGLGESNHPAFLTFSFEEAMPSYYSDYELRSAYPANVRASFQALVSSERELARRALQEWADACGLTVFEVPAGQGDLRFLKVDFNLLGNTAAGFAYGPLVDFSPTGIPFSAPHNGDVFLRAGGSNYSDYYIFLHEIGHALGLTHPFGSEVQWDESTLQNGLLSVMNYIRLEALGPIDRDAIISVYGPAAADGTQVASWSWNAATLTLTQSGFSTSDRIRGVGVSDVIDGNDGDDIVFGDLGDDTVRGGSGVDRLGGGYGADQLFGDDGDDALFGDQGDDTLHGGVGNDQLRGGLGVNRLFGGDGDDTLRAFGGPGTYDGGAGTDQLFIEMPNSTDYGSNGRGESFVLSEIIAAGGSVTGIEMLSVTGGHLADTMSGATADNYLLAGDGDDLLIAGPGRDQFNGQAGFDIVDYSAETAPVVQTVNIFRIVDGQAEFIFGIEGLIGSAFGDALTGDGEANLLHGGGGDDSLFGLAGDDRLAGGAGVNLLDGGDGVDLADFASSLSPVTVSLLISGAQVTGFGLDSLLSIESLAGSIFADSLTGSTDANAFTGGGGSDLIDGGGGLDRSIYAAPSIAYEWWSQPDGSWKVKDLRAAGPEGTDTLLSVETLQFSDKSVNILGLTTAEKLTDAYSNILRNVATGGELAFLNGLVTSVGNASKTLAAAITEIVGKADQTTAVAAMSYQFFLNFVPSKGGFDYLVSPQGPNPNNINSAYYQSFNIENRYINFAVNLGKVGEGAPSFLAEYGAKTLFQATKDAYMEIFGGTVVDSKINTILDSSVGSMSRAQYFALYGGDGLTGIGAKAAMVGWLLTEAAKADLGMYARSSNAFLTDLADGAQTLVDIVGTYGQPGYVFNG